MSIVFLLRHATTVAARPGMADRDRPLSDAGRREAEAMGVAMRQRGYRPELIICSPAQRARETLEGIATAGSLPTAHMSERLYSGQGSDYLEAVRSAGQAASVMLIGHNPMTENMAAALTGSHEPEALQRLASGFPPAGLAIISFPVPPAEALSGGGHLEAFLMPPPC